MFSESRFWSFSLLTDVLCSLLYNIWYHKMPPYLIKIFLSLRHKMKLKNVPAFPKYILKITHKSETWRKKRRKEKKREKEKEKERKSPVIPCYGRAHLPVYCFMLMPFSLCDSLWFLFIQPEHFFPFF